MQVKKKFLQEDGDTKKFLAAGDAYKKKCLLVNIFQTRTLG